MSCPVWNTYVGLDYGATFSKVTVMQETLRSPRTTFEHIVPTTLAQNTSSQTIEYPHSESRALITKSSVVMEFFKLAIMEPEVCGSRCVDPKLAAFVKDQLFKLAKSGIPKTDVTAIFLKGFWGMIKEKLENDSQCHHVVNVAVTYPSCWGEEEFGRLKLAVNQADIPSRTTSVRYITEHVAATYGILDEYGTGILQGLHEGDSIMVVDGGGGTTDSALCKIKYDADRSLIPGEFVEIDSFLYGTKSIDLGFDALVSDKLSWVKLPANLDPDMVKQRALKDWKESKKPDVIYQLLDLFTGDVSFKTPEGPFYFGIHSDGVYDIFQEAVNRVFGVVTRFCESAKRHNTQPKVLFLTGGLFGISSIAAKIEQKVKSDLGGGIQVKVATEEQRQLAVSRGAALWLNENGN